MMGPHKNLAVWQKAMEFVTLLYKYTATFPQHELFGLVSQMRRAAVSITSNIAEGYGRSSNNDLVHFLHNSLGSSNELDTQITIACSLGYLTEDVNVEVVSMEDEVTPVGVDNPYFIVEGGVLKLKEGVNLNSATSVEIPADAIRIPSDSNLFNGNKSIKSVTIPANSQLEVIEANAFQNSGLTSFIAPASLKTISANAFNGCYDLASVDFKNVKTIGDYAFAGCEKLSSEDTIAGGQKISSIGDGAFKQSGFTTFEFETIGKYSPSLSLGRAIFTNCDSLTYINFANNISEIPEEALSGCDKLTKVNMGSGAATIKKNAFYRCGELKEINFRNVVTIEESAFAECSKISSVDFVTACLVAISINSLIFFQPAP